MRRLAGHGALIVILTMLTQLGGIAWGLALLFRRRSLAFVLFYAGLSTGAMYVAPVMGRVPLSCLSDQALTVQSPMYCVLNRQYVTPELRDVLVDMSQHMDETFPGTVTQVLDANFPFVTGFPLLPHLSHHDGRKVDLAFYYRNGDGYSPRATRSPIGYFAFEDGPTQCPQQWPTLRWNLGWLQGLWRDLRVDEPLMVAALNWLGRDDRIGKIFIEPHLQASLGIAHPKVRFQGCRAARHDDHIHIQL
ncbi:hypothetical protein L0664_05895 [Octadecabacter sp. G9-8]|uniref:Uncharacterized protein n=1 Tax=Octadecabacter dasysiphoniae TaxID=2909341 RepID=A0ABS9CTM4_9RHOB|nr:hypothetical protein [Octadecabacter dasysiphoniae]MCF2870591.1 hypothetical protein [Octadecabacter dasysiphoniae]